MKHFSNINETDIITRYFAQQTSAEENDMLQKWLAESKENTDSFNKLKEIWEDSNDHTSLDKEFQTLQSWEKVKNTLHKPSAKTRRMVSIKWLSVAASVLLLLGFGFYYIYNANKEIRVVSYKHVLKITMPDNSIVWLNRYSELIYRKSYLKNRSVKFSGEGYFEVMPDSMSRFEIITTHATITVLGTKFNVKANPQDSLTEVVVRTGKVRLSPNKAEEGAGNNIVLNAGEKGSSAVDAIIPQKKIADDPNYLSWKTHEFTFNNTNIKEIVSLINKIYDTNVVLAYDNTENCNLTGQYSWQSINDILDMLQIVLNIEVERTGNKIIIKTSGC
jgi:transmembrane sensor